MQTREEAAWTLTCSRPSPSTCARAGSSALPVTATPRKPSKPWGCGGRRCRRRTWSGSWTDASRYRSFLVVGRLAGPEVELLHVAVHECDVEGGVHVVHRARALLDELELVREGEDARLLLGVEAPAAPRCAADAHDIALAVLGDNLPRRDREGEVLVAGGALALVLHDLDRTRGDRVGRVLADELVAYYWNDFPLSRPAPERGAGAQADRERPECPEQHDALPVHCNISFIRMRVPARSAELESDDQPRRAPFASQTARLAVCGIAHACWRILPGGGILGGRCRRRWKW